MNNFAKLTNIGIFFFAIPPIPKITMTQTFNFIHLRKESSETDIKFPEQFAVTIPVL